MKIKIFFSKNSNGHQSKTVLRMDLKLGSCHSFTKMKILEKFKLSRIRPDFFFIKPTPKTGCVPNYLID